VPDILYHRCFVPKAFRILGDLYRNGNGLHARKAKLSCTDKDSSKVLFTQVFLYFAMKYNTHVQQYDNIQTRDLPKTGFTFSVVNENDAENDFAFTVRNQNETENLPSFSHCDQLTTQSRL